MFLFPTTEKEITNIIKNIKSKTSVGLDGIPNSVIKNSAQSITGPVSLLINNSFTSGIFPDSLKHAIIKPIFKKGEKSNIELQAHFVIKWIFKNI